MATTMLKAISNKGTHGVGNLNSMKVKTLNHGAIVIGADVDNFTLGELGFNAEGERTVKQLSDHKKKAVLIASPERRYMGEELVDFYNEVGERVRCVILEEGYTRFDTSSFALTAEVATTVTGVTEIKAGQVAHFDKTLKKFTISDAVKPHADYALAKAKFLVVNSEDDLAYLCGLPTVRLEVIEA